MYIKSVFKKLTSGDKRNERKGKKGEKKKIKVVKDTNVKLVSTRAVHNVSEGEGEGQDPSSYYYFELLTQVRSR